MDPIAEVAELCYIPTFGGGFGFSWAEVEAWPLSRKRRALEWLEERRATEQKSLGQAAGRGAAAGRRYGRDGPGPSTVPPRGPVLSGPPSPPVRSPVDGPGRGPQA